MHYLRNRYRNETRVRNAGNCGGGSTTLRWVALGHIERDHFNKRVCSSDIAEIALQDTCTTCVPLQKAAEHGSALLLEKEGCIGHITFNFDMPSSLDEHDHFYQRVCSSNGCTAPFLSHTPEIRSTHRPARYSTCVAPPSSCSAFASIVIRR